MARKTDRKKTINRKRKGTGKEKRKGTKKEEVQEIQVGEIISLLRNNWVQLFIVIAISLFFRLYAINYDYFVGSDTAIHYSIVRESIENRAVLDHYNLSTFPTGSMVNKPKGQYYLAVLVGLNNFGLILPFIGVITVVVLFFMMREYDEDLAFLACVILSFTLANVYRTQANVFRGDAITELILISSFFLMIRMFKNKKYIYPILIGLLAGISSLFWIGYPLVLAMITSVFVFISLYQFFRDKREDLEFTAISFLIFGLISKAMISVFELVNLLVQHKFTSNNYFMLLFFVPIAILNIIFYLATRYGFNFKRKALILTLIAVAFGAIVFLNLEAFVNIATGYALVGGGYDINISELISPNFTDFWDLYNLMIFIFPIGTLFFILNWKEFEEREYLLLAWSIVSIYLLFSSRRFLFHASFIVCIMSAYLFVRLPKVFNKVKELKNNSWIAPFVIILLISVSIYLSYSKIEIFSPFFDDYWYDATQWLKQNSAPGDGVLTYWDYGSFVQAYAEMSTATDSIYGQHVNRINEFDSFLVNNTALKDYGARYLITDKLTFYRLPWTDISFIKFDSIEINDDQTEVVKFTDFDSGTVVEVYPELAPNVGFVVSGDQRIPFDKTLVQIEQEVYEISALENVTTMAGCFYYSFEIPLWVDENVCDSNYFKLAFGQGVDEVVAVYRNEEVTIFEVI